MSKDLLTKIGGIFLSVVLVIVIFLEFRYGFNMVHNRQMSEVNKFVEAASNYGKANVSIDEVTTYTEVPDVVDTGNVIKVKGFDVKVKLNGELTKDVDEDMGTYSYSSETAMTQCVLSVSRYESKVTDYRNAVKHFWYGETDELAKLVYDGDIPSDVQFYQCTYRGGNTPVLYSESEKLYNMVILGEGEYYLLLSCQEPFKLTYENQTLAYGDPIANPQNFHTYSKYEEWATAATLIELKDKDKNDKDKKDKDESPYKTSDVPGTAATYTSKADDTLREQLASLGKFTWNKDGTSKDTDLKVDISSDEAKKSKWTLTETTYSYETSGIKLYALSGSRSAESFTVEGTVQNTLNAERPYVVVVKYLDSNDELLGISVIDKRSSSLKPEGVDKFSVSITPSANKIDIQRITSLMFEIY